MSKYCTISLRDLQTIEDKGFIEAALSSNKQNNLKLRQKIVVLIGLPFKHFFVNHDKMLKIVRNLHFL